MKRTVSRKRCKNHLEIIIRVEEKEKGRILGEKVKRALIKWKRSLDMDISFEIITIIDRNNHQAM